MSRPPSGGDLDWGVGVEGAGPRIRGVSVEGGVSVGGESGTASPQEGGESGAASEVVPVPLVRERDLC